MTLAIFQKMAQGVLASLGEDAFFNGSSTPTKVNIEHGVELAGVGGEQAANRGDLVTNRDVLTLSSSLSPKAGDTVTFVATGKSYRLEHLVEDNGVTQRFAALPRP